MIQFKCPHCGKSARANDNAVGRRCRCAKCGKSFRVPEKPDTALDGFLAEFDKPSATSERTAIPVEGETSSASVTAQPQRRPLTWRHWTLIGFGAVFCLGLIGRLLPDNGKDSGRRAERAGADRDSVESPPAEGSTATVGVMVRDKTAERPLHPRAEIWFRGHGSWFFANDARLGSATRVLGRRECGVRYSGDDAIQLYPDGRDGKEVNIPFLVEVGKPAAIIVEISDDEVHAKGHVVKSALGKTVRVDR